MSENSQHERPTKRKRRPIYSKADKNAIIDSTMHPLSEVHPLFILVDGLLHAANERNPSESLRKFVKYNLPELLKRILEEHD